MNKILQMTIQVIVADACPAESNDDVATMIEKAVGQITGLHNPEIIEIDDIGEQDLKD